MSGGTATYYVEQALEALSAGMIVIDTRYNDTAAGREDGCPIVGTDGAGGGNRAGADYRRYH